MSKTITIIEDGHIILYLPIDPVEAFKIDFEGKYGIYADVSGVMSEIVIKQNTPMRVIRSGGFFKRYDAGKIPDGYGENSPVLTQAKRSSE